MQEHICSPVITELKYKAPVFIFFFLYLFFYQELTLAVLLYLQPQVEHMDLLDFSVIAVILQAETLALWLLGRTFRPLQLVGWWV